MSLVERHRNDFHVGSHGSRPFTHYTAIRETDSHIANTVCVFITMCFQAAWYAVAVQLSTGESERLTLGPLQNVSTTTVQRSKQMSYLFGKLLTFNLATPSCWNLYTKPNGKIQWNLRAHSCSQSDQLPHEPMTSSLAPPLWTNFISLSLKTAKSV